MPKKKINKNGSITRRDSRERAVQIMYSLEFNNVTDINEYLKNYEKEIYKSMHKDKYLLELLDGILKNLNEIDEIIDSRIDYSIKSLGKLVLSVLRLGVYELKFEELKPTIAISEALNIVQKYGSSEDTRFINALLDNVIK